MRNGTGPYAARFLSSYGAEVSAVAGSSQATAAAAAEELAASCGASATPYPTLRAMLAESGIEALAICSPAELHEEHLEAALKAGLHVFCEKPLVWWGGPVAARCARIADGFADRGRLLFVNHQWIHTLEAFAALYGPLLPARPARSFAMELAPSRGGDALFYEAVSHPASLLVALGADGPLDGGEARWSPHRDALTLTFRAAARHGAIDARIDLAVCERPPRPASYTIDGRRMDRSLGAGYGFTFTGGGGRVAAEDPLALSTACFLRWLRSGWDAAAVRASIERQSLLFDGLRELAFPAGAGARLPPS